MRDYHSGPQWDYRTLGDLRWHRIRVVCLVCRHYTYLEPRQLAKRYGAKGAWRLLIPKLRCTSCGLKRVDATAEKLPRN